MSKSEIHSYLGCIDWPKKGESLDLRGNEYFMFYFRGGKILTLQQGDDLMPDMRTLRSAIAIRSWFPYASGYGGDEELVTKDFYVKIERYKGELKREVRKR